MTSFDLNVNVEELMPEGCGELVSDCCNACLPQECVSGELVICPDCLDHCEAVSL